MGGRLKSLRRDALLPSSDVGRKGGTCQARSWHKALCTPLVTREKDFGHVDKQGLITGIFVPSVAAVYCLK